MKTLSYGYIPMYKITKRERLFVFSGNTTFYIKGGKDLLLKYRTHREGGSCHSIFYEPMNGREIDIGTVLIDKCKINMNDSIDNFMQNIVINSVCKLLVQLIKTYDTKPVTVDIYYDGRCIKCSSFITNERYRDVGFCQTCYEGKFGVLKR